MVTFCYERLGGIYPSHALMHLSYFFLPSFILGRFKGLKGTVKGNFFFFNIFLCFLLSQVICVRVSINIRTSQAWSSWRLNIKPEKNMQAKKNTIKGRIPWLHVTDVPRIHSRDLLTSPPWARSWSHWGVECLTKSQIMHEEPNLSSNFPH